MAGLLALQIPLLYNLGISFIDPGFQLAFHLDRGIWAECRKTYATGGFLDVVNFNIWKGRSITMAWFYYHGRYFQLMAFLIIGFLLARKGFFHRLNERKPLMWQVIFICTLVFFVLLGLALLLPYSGFNELHVGLISTLLRSYINFVLSFIILFGIMLIYPWFKHGMMVKYLASYGRMSLSNYLFQSILGVTFFYAFGLGMYRYIGETLSLILAILFSIFQVGMSQVWMTYFYYGSFEWLWRALTKFDFNIQMLRMPVHSFEVEPQSTTDTPALVGSSIG